MTDDLNPLRIVIQQIGIEKPSYRVIGYGDWEKPRHSDFASAQTLIETLQAVVPKSVLSELHLNLLGENQGTIKQSIASAFQQDVVVNESHHAGVPAPRIVVR